MKRFAQCVFVVCMALDLSAQVPQKMSYQAVIRNSNNQLVTNGSIGMRISILKGSSSGTVVYSEIYNPNPVTNINGLVSLEIGTGIPITGNFTTIDWANGPYFIKTETDPTGATNYTIIATKELISVPYALHAANSASYSEGQGISIQNNSISLDDQNAQNDQVLKWNGTAWIPGTDNSGGSYNAGQGIDISGNAISLAKQNAQTGQVLKWNGTGWVPSVDSNSASLWLMNGNNIYRNTGFVGIGNNNPAYPLDVRMARKNGLMRVFDEAVDTAHRNPITVSYHNSANTGVGILSYGGKNPFKNLDSLHVNPLLSHIGLLGAGDDFGIAGTGNTGVIGTGIDGGRFKGNTFGVIADGDQAILAFGKTIGASIYGKTWVNGDYLEIFSGNPDVVFPVAHYFETTENSGYFVQFSPSGNENLVNTHLINKPDNNVLVIKNGANQEAGIYLDNSNRGIVFGDIKSFRMKHPEKTGKEIWYASVEGPEAAAYVRGSATLVNGEATIVFTKDFQIVANSKTMTVILTPGSPDSKGLSFLEKTETGFKVKELYGGNGNYTFDWEVKCVRKGYEDYKVIRDEDETKLARPKDTTKSIRQKLPDRLSGNVK